MHIFLWSFQISCPQNFCIFCPEAQRLYDIVCVGGCLLYEAIVNICIIVLLNLQEHRTFYVECFKINLYHMYFSVSDIVKEASAENLNRAEGVILNANQLQSKEV